MCTPAVFPILYRKAWFPLHPSPGALSLSPLPVTSSSHFLSSSLSPVSAAHRNVGWPCWLGSVQVIAASPWGDGVQTPNCILEAGTAGNFKGGNHKETTPEPLPIIMQYCVCMCVMGREAHMCAMACVEKSELFSVSSVQVLDIEPRTSSVAASTLINWAILMAHSHPPPLMVHGTYINLLVSNYLLLICEGMLSTLKSYWRSTFNVTIVFFLSAFQPFLQFPPLLWASCHTQFLLPLCRKTVQNN